MNVLIVSQYFWPENFRINDLAEGLKERGHTITVLTGIPNYPSGRFFSGYGYFKRRIEDYHGIRVLRVPLVPRGMGGAFRLGLNYISFAFFSCILSPFLVRDKIDLIIVFQLSPVTMALPGLVLKKLKNVPIMLWVQDLWPESLSATMYVKSTRLLGIVEALVRFIYRGCDLILVQSRAFSSSVQKLGVDTQRILYYPNSAEPLYRPLELESDAPERHGMPYGFRVMFAGNIGVAQDFPTILAAAMLLKHRRDIHWIILGDGSMRSHVQEQVRKQGLTETVHLLGSHPPESMPRYFSLAEVLLVTLKRDPIFALTIPSKVQSYLACAKPIIAGLDGEGAHIIEESGAGISCPSEDPQALADAVLKMYEMPEAQRKLLGLRGRSYFEEHFERALLLDRLDGWMNILKKGEKTCAF